MIRSTRGRSVSGVERRWLKVFSSLNEFQARLFAADKALDWGRGGISRLSALTGLSRTTITKAVEELEGGRKLVSPPEGRVRRVGGGRKKVEQVDPAIRDLLRWTPRRRSWWDPLKMRVARGGPRGNRRRSIPKISRVWPRARRFRMGSTTADRTGPWSTWESPMIRRNLRWKASGDGGNWTDEKPIRRRGDY